MNEMDTGTPHLKLTFADGVAMLTIDNVADDNRLTPQSIAALGSAVAHIGARDDINAVLLTGAGDIFSLGLLNPSIRAGMTKEDVVRFVLHANQVFDALERLPQVVVCAVNGPLRAGASELTLACDIRVAADTCDLALPEAGWGGFPGAGAPVRLPGIIGHGQALKLICTGELIDASEMLRLGLVEAVYPAASLREEAVALARKIASAGPLATRGAKQIMRVRQQPGLYEARALSDALRRALEWSQDVDEGMAAHAANRKPEFVGR